MTLQAAAEPGRFYESICSPVGYSEAQSKNVTHHKKKSSASKKILPIHGVITFLDTHKQIKSMAAPIKQMKVKVTNHANNKRFKRMTSQALFLARRVVRKQVANNDKD